MIKNIFLYIYILNLKQCMMLLTEINKNYINLEKEVIEDNIEQENENDTDNSKINHNPEDELFKNLYMNKFSSAFGKEVNEIQQVN